MNKKLRTAPFLSFYCFKQTFCFEDEFDGYAKSCDFAEDAKIKSWLQFWNSQGDEIVLRLWNIKYKDYIVKTDEESHTNNYLAEEESETEKKVELLTNFSNNISPEYKTYGTEALSWQDLWEEHSIEVYTDQFKQFEYVYESYLHTLGEAVKNPIISKTAEIQYLQEINTEIESLKLAGLPTAFVSTKQSKNKTFHKKKQFKRQDDFYELSKADFNHNGESEDDLYFSATDNSDIEFELDFEMPPIKDLFSHESKEQNKDEMHATKNRAISKQQKKNRTLRMAPEFIQNEKELHKYWRQRFSLFSLFDEGIQLDRESWFSVTPEKVAKHIAERMARALECVEESGLTVVDGFCGCGGNTIQFAKTFSKVIAIDIDPNKIEMAKHNANIYGVAHKIDFIVGDFLQFSQSGIKADAVFLSPPWGGPEYKTVEKYNIERCLEPVSASELMRITRQISSNVAFFLPRNADIQQIIRLAEVGEACEVEHNFLDTRKVGLTAFYGDCIEKQSKQL